MTSVLIKPIMSAATASLIAFGAHAAQLVAEAEPKLAPQNNPLCYEVAQTSPSNDNVKFSYSTYSSVSLEKEISQFYSELAANQTYIGEDIENILAVNISSLYED